MSSFTCRECGASFRVPPAALEKYPGWVPRLCLPCKDRASGNGGAAPRPATRGSRPAGPSGGANGGGAGTAGVPLDEHPRLLRVLERHQEGPDTGVFTDGGASPNPGPAGWGVVWVEDGVILEQRRGESAHATNNQMELQALIEAYRLLPPERPVPVYSDSDLCVKTINQWAAGWQRRGWTRKTGPIKNLELVKELWALTRGREHQPLRWAPAHSGWRWNEYADALATLHLRTGSGRR